MKIDLDSLKKKPSIKKHFSKIVPIECKTCNLYKILPYDYISDTCKKADIENCKLCVSIIYKSAKKFREDNTRRHLASDSRCKRMALAINGRYCKRTDLFELSKLAKLAKLAKLEKQHKIQYYKMKNNHELVAILKNFIC